MFTHLCWIQKLFVLMLVMLFALSISSVLSGCGNKGDLYLPEKGSSNDATVKSKTKKKS